MTFDALGLVKPLLDALSKEGYSTPTPIQAQAIPQILAGKDVLGCAQTGTGKTAAFALPMLQLLAANAPQVSQKRTIRALILTPTRELAGQIRESFDAYGRFLNLNNLVIFGGVGQQPQTDALRRGTDILVATPGRLLDLMQQGFISLSSVELFVLDEADRMLDMGFVHDVRKVIAKLPQNRQSLFFSATMAPEILSLASAILRNPVQVAVTPVSSTAETVKQENYFVEQNDKRRLLINILDDPKHASVLVFTRTKHGANRLVKDLEKANIYADAIHGNKSQQARQRALGQFKAGTLRVLVATDIAARGIDVDGLSLVVNYELPNIPETYVHRIGRTGRAGASGEAISFCAPDERDYLRDIQKLIAQQIPTVSDHLFQSVDCAPIPFPSNRSMQSVNRPQVAERTPQRPFDNQRKPAAQQPASNKETANDRNHWRPWKYNSDKANAK